MLSVGSKLFDRMQSMELEDRCQWKHCRAESGMIYFGVGLCMPHWVLACDKCHGKNIETRKMVHHFVIPSAQKAMRRHKERNDGKDG